MARTPGEIKDLEDEVIANENRQNMVLGELAKLKNYYAVKSGTPHAIVCSS